MTPLIRTVGSVLVACFVLALPATAWAQTEDEPFRRGLAARGDKKWPQVVDAMRQAIAINRAESTRKVQVRSRLLFGTGTEYLPHYFLGEALKNANDCGGAVAEWEISEEQKVVLSLPEFAAGLRAGYKECAAKGVLLRDDYRQQVSTIDQLYEEAFGMATRLDRVKGVGPDLWKSDVEAEFERARTDLGLAQRALVKARATRLLADFNESKNASARAASVLRPLESRLGAAVNTRALIAQQSAETQQLLTGIETTNRAVDAAKVALPADLAASRDSARALATRARERLAVAEKTQNATAAGEALKLAQDASDASGKVLEQVNNLARGEFDRRFQQVVAAASEQFSFVATSFATLDRLVAEKPGAVSPAMSAERESLQKTYSSLQRRFDNSRRTENIAGVEDAMHLAVEARTRIDALIKTFGPATLRDRGVHPALEQAARLYFEGEYQQVLSSLDPLGSAIDVTFQVHVHLFRAAALYALYVRSGETNQKFRSDALAAVQRCQEIDPAFQPSARAFSPRFVSFFKDAITSSTPTVSAAATQ
jgi:chemotaxis regulatin CheY-phosphate phosphatase CheZ